MENNFFTENGPIHILAQIQVSLDDYKSILWMVHQVNWIPVVHPTITKFSMHLINPPNKSHLNWSRFFGPSHF